MREARESGGSDTKNQQEDSREMKKRHSLEKEVEKGRQEKARALRDTSESSPDLLTLTPMSDAIWCRRAKRLSIYGMQVG